MNISTIVTVCLGASAFFLGTAELAENKLTQLNAQKEVRQASNNKKPVSIEAGYTKDSITVVEKFKEYEDIHFNDSLIFLHIRFTDGQAIPNYKLKPLKDSIYSTGYPVYSDEKKYIKVDIQNSNKSVKINDSLKIKIPQVEIKPRL